MNAVLNTGPAQRAPSYYSASLNDHTEYPQLKGTVQVDVAIIGGGFTGVATAVELAERGLKLDVVIELLVDDRALVGRIVKRAEEAKAAGVYVFGGGIDESVDPVLVHADGATSPATTHLDGGFCVLRLGSREEAESWAARIARGCRTPQELRAFQYDPAS